MIKDDPEFPDTPEPEPKKGALDYARDELGEATLYVYQVGDAAMFHTQLAIGYALVALCERIDRVSEPVYTHPSSGTVQYKIKTGG